MVVEKCSFSRHALGLGVWILIVAAGIAVMHMYRDGDSIAVYNVMMWGPPFLGSLVFIFLYPRERVHMAATGSLTVIALCLMSSVTALLLTVLAGPFSCAPGGWPCSTNPPVDGIGAQIVFGAFTGAIVMVPTMIFWWALRVGQMTIKSLRSARM